MRSQAKRQPEPIARVQARDLVAARKSSVASNTPAAAPAESQGADSGSRRGRSTRRTLESRIATVAMIDMAGYSRRIAIDPQQTILTWKAIRRDVIEPFVARHGGVTRNFAGDGLVLEFSESTKAVACALEIQEAIAQSQETRSLESRLAFRMGIHVDEVFTDGKEVHGNAANVAARLQTFALPGTVVVSDEVRASLAPAASESAVEIGVLRLRNIPRPVRAYRLGQAAEQQVPSKVLARRSSASLPSLAALPFRITGGDAPDRYLAESVTEEIVANLSQLPDLFVLSHESMRRYRVEDVDPLAIGRELGIKYIVSGRVRQSEGSLQVTVETTDVETGRLLWSGRQQCGKDQIYDLHNSLARDIALAIVPEIQRAELRRIGRKMPESLDAYECVVRGSGLLYGLTERSFGQAHDFFLRAIDLDPEYGRAHALLALWHSIRLGQGWSADPAADESEAATYANAAVALDPDDALALAWSGHARAVLFRDYSGALELFDRAVEVSPNSAVAWVRSSPTYSYIGQGRTAYERAATALRLSPQNPQIFYTYSALGFASLIMGDYPAAVSWGEKARAQNPSYTANLRFLVAALAAVNQLDRARQVGAEIMRLEPSFRVGGFVRRHAISEAARREQLGELLRKAGLPD